MDFHLVDVVQRSEGDVVCLVECRLDGRVVGCGHGTAGAAVECLADGQDFLASGVERCSLECILVSFGSAVAEEEGMACVTALFSEIAGQLHLQGVLHGIGVETKLCQLLLHHLYIDGMAVSDGNDCVASVKVQVLCAFLVPYIASSAAYRLDGPQLICLEKFH